MKSIKFQINILKQYKQLRNLNHILSIHNYPYFLQLLYCSHSQQHRSYYDLKEKERLDKEIPQDNLKTKNHGIYSTSSLEYYQASGCSKQSTDKYQNHFTTNKRNS